MEKVGVASPILTPEIARKLLGLEYGRKRGKSSEGILNASSILTLSLHGTVWGDLCGDKQTLCIPWVSSVCWLGL